MTVISILNELRMEVENMRAEVRIIRSALEKYSGPYFNDGGAAAREALKIIEENVNFRPMVEQDSEWPLVDDSGTFKT